MISRSALRGVLAATTLLSPGCGSMMDADLATQLLSVSPGGGATGVARNSDVVLSFNRAMMAGMEQYLVLHEGRLTGPTVSMSCTWSDGQRTLTCRPAQPLAAGTRYTMHVGGGMRDADGRQIGMGHCLSMGGQWATPGMMGGQTGMMGSGWMHPNGSYGMIFEFTTGS